MPKGYLLKFNIGPSFKATNKASYQNKDVQKQFKSKGKTIKAFPLKIRSKTGMPGSTALLKVLDGPSKPMQ